MKKIIIIAAVVLVAAVAAVFLFVMNPKEPPPEPRIEYSVGEPFITNVFKSNHLLKTALVLVVNDEKLVDALPDRNVEIRDTILFILRAMTEEELGEEGTQDKLRNRIISATNNALGIDNIVGVRFNDFVMN